MPKPTKYDKLIIDDESYETRLTKKYRTRKQYQAADPKKVLAVIPGVITEIRIKDGARVSRGDSLMILEAMKMKNDVFAPLDGKIIRIRVHIGDVVTKNQLLVEYE